MVKELVKLFHLYAFNKDSSYVDVSFLMVPILADHSFELVFFYLQVFKLYPRGPYIFIVEYLQA